MYATCTKMDGFVIKRLADIFDICITILDISMSIVLYASMIDQKIGGCLMFDMK